MRVLALVVLLLLATRASAQSSSSSSGGGGLTQALIYECSSGAETVLTAGGVDTPQCVTGNGAWVPAPQSFWSQSVDYDSATALWSEIFTVLSIAYGVRVIARLMRRRG